MCWQGERNGVWTKNDCHKCNCLTSDSYGNHLAGSDGTCVYCGLPAR